MGPGFIALGFGLSFTFPILMFSQWSANFNPAVSMGLLVRGKLGFVDFIAYTVSEVAGAFIAGLFVYMIYFPFFAIVPTVNGYERILSYDLEASKAGLSVSYGLAVSYDAAAVAADQGAKLSVFATTPQFKSMHLYNCVVEMSGTALLVFCLSMMGSRWDMEGNAQTAQTGGTAGPLLIGLFIMILILSVGGPTAISANPARDMGPRLAHLILPIPGKGSSEIVYGLMVAAACLAGGALGGGLFYAVELILRP
ncbi:hypothetical protein HDU98_008345 [Podochytrium sp. JEL0797]|nr:hypothetical protein HDU98_008345 [Podochytrium sp. JEL0797]